MILLLLLLLTNQNWTETASFPFIDTLCCQFHMPFHGGRTPTAWSVDLVSAWSWLENERRKSIVTNRSKRKYVITVCCTYNGGIHYMCWTVPFVLEHEWNLRRNVLLNGFTAHIGDGLWFSIYDYFSVDRKFLSLIVFYIVLIIISSNKSPVEVRD